jgi:2-polyprenyl-3-methyl-5-hydroxy-6-metoxy-1,4-benzoquinol methylase
MDYSKFIDDIARQTFIQTKNWDARDWKNFRKEYYENYFTLRDSLTINVSKKEPNAHKDMHYFRIKKLENIKNYNYKYGIRT